MTLMKKLVIWTVIFAVAATSLGIFIIYRYKLAQREKRQNAKAEEVSVKIIEGWTISDIAKHLEYDQQRKDLPHIMPANDFLQAEKTFDASNFPILKSKPAGADLEGFLFPDTYRFTKTTLLQQNSKAIISKMLENFSLKFTPQMQAQAQKRGMSVYQIITLASIIEKEAGGAPASGNLTLDSQRKIIAGVFYNRLSSNMPLQSDATINYITKKSNPSASQADLDIDSLYNTYKYKGLPPGPISNPSLSSIMAALYPETTDYFYFLHKQPTGEVVFSKTYEEHLKNKAMYLK